MLWALNLEQEATLIQGLKPIFSKPLSADSRFSLLGVDAPRPWELSFSEELARGAAFEALLRLDSVTP